MQGEDIVFDWFQYRSGRSAKEWAIGLSAAGDVEIRYGRIGSKVRPHSIPRAKVAHPAQEMKRRISEQLKDGYKPCGRAVVKDGLLQPFTPPPQPPAQPPPALDVGKQLIVAPDEQDLSVLSF